MHRQTASLATLAVLCAWLPSASRAVTQAESQQLVELSPEASAAFGSAVAISPSGATAAVAASGRSPAGAVDLYSFDGADWIYDGTVIDPDAVSADNFGASVAVFGDRIVVGAPGALTDTDPGPGIVLAPTGAAYVFLRDPVQGWTTPEAKLVALDGAADDSFGTSVAISDTAALVGAELEDSATLTNSGSAYVFRRTGTSWVHEKKLVAPATGAASDDLFGASVALSGGTALVGADGRNADAGEAYVFLNAGTEWTLDATLMGPTPVTADGFGFAVALSGSTALVGAEGRNGTGAAYVFRDEGSGWIQKAELLADVPTGQDRFGHSVGVTPTSAVVGALGNVDFPAGNGKAFSFRFNGSSWLAVSELIPSTGALGDLFGNSVAVSGTQVLVGAVRHDGISLPDTGAAYAFVPEPGALALHAAALASLACLGRARRRQRV